MTSMTREYCDVQGITFVKDWLFRDVVGSESYRLYRNRRLAQQAREVLIIIVLWTAYSLIASFMWFCVPEQTEEES